MDYTTEVVNITKIKDGFFLGDEATANNLDVIIQFKITHMVNAAGSQIINAWESIGIKYLTLNWSEHQNQNLFDQKDEIASRIVNFIDDSMKAGEGLLVHSLRGQNRGCIVVVIYLIKKFRWTLGKALEFLTNKKFDVEIPKYFLNQLALFDNRLSKSGQGPRSNTWADCGLQGDVEELVIKNTYLNGLAQIIEKSSNSSSNLLGDIKRGNYSSGEKRISWPDKNTNNNFNNGIGNKSLLCSMNMNRELIYQKDIKPVTAHKKLRPVKSCLKNSNSNSNLNPSSILNNNYSNSNFDNFELKKSPSGLSISSKSGEIGNTKQKNNNNSNNLHSSMKNNTSNNGLGTYNIDMNMNMSLNHPNFSNKSNNTLNANLSKSTNFENKKPENNKLKNNNQQSIISPQGRQNNFTINNNAQQRSHSVGHDPKQMNNQSNNFMNNNQINNSNISSQQNNQIIIASKYKNVVHNNYNNIYIQSPTGLDNVNMLNNNLSNNTQNLNQNQNQNFNLPQHQQQQMNSKLTKSAENQKLPQNNYFIAGMSGVNSNNLKVIDYPSQIKGSYINAGSGNQTKVTGNSYSKSINNYQPELNRKNNPRPNPNPTSNSTGLLNRGNSQFNKGPIRIQNEYERKPSTPDNIYHSNYSSVKLGNSSIKLKNQNQINQYGGTLKRTNSIKKNKNEVDRPSTAPQKGNDKNSQLKRLPSPSVKSNTGPSNKISMGQSNLAKYRSPSPSTLNKSASLNLKNNTKSKLKK